MEIGAVTQTRAITGCYTCGELGHLARDCPSGSWKGKGKAGGKGDWKGKGKGGNPKGKERAKATRARAKARATGRARARARTRAISTRYRGQTLRSGSSHRHLGRQAPLQRRLLRARGRLFLLWVAHPSRTLRPRRPGIPQRKRAQRTAGRPQRKWTASGRAVLGRMRWMERAAAGQL